jgi:type I restriction enzyme, S subunit
MSFARYGKYKNSGVEWLGEIPQHWEVRRLRFVCDIRTGGEDTANAVEDGEFPFFVRSQTVERINTWSEDCEAVLTAGDGVGVGKVFHHYRGRFDYHQRVYAFVNFRDVSGRFFFHYIKENFYKVALEGGAKSTVDSLRMPLIQNFAISIPSPPEQVTITAFLDRETAKIDALVGEQQRLIELLKEKRQAVISHAVTKGLDPNVPMKDSGVEWLGEVPEHWEVTGIKRVCSNITDGAHVSPETEGGAYFFISTKDVTERGIDFNGSLLTSPASYQYLERTGCRPFVGDVLFSKDGTIGRTVVVTDELEFVVASSLIIIRPKKDQLDSDFLHYLCQSAFVRCQVDGYVKGAGLPRLSIQNLLRVVGVVPPIHEQKDIAARLKTLIAKFDALIEEAGGAISILQERRSALISAAVTGKIDVRGLVEPAAPILDVVAA